MMMMMTTNNYHRGLPHGAPLLGACAAGTELKHALKVVALRDDDFVVLELDQLGVVQHRVPVLLGERVHLRARRLDERFLAGKTLREVGRWWGVVMVMVQKNKKKKNKKRWQ